MAFTQVPITGTIKLPNSSTPAVGALVTFTLNTPMTDGTTLISPTPVQAVCDSSGNFTITLPANDDTTTTPLGTFYGVVISTAAQPFVPIDAFTISVPKASVAGVNLFSIATLLNPATVSAFVSQLVAGTGMAVSPSSGTGQVTITATGGTTASSLLTFTRPGNLAVETGTMRLRFSKVANINSVAAEINTAPTGSSVIVDVLKNGSTIYTTTANRPTIAAGANASGDAVPDLPSVAIGDYFTINIVQVGSTITGADLSVTILYH